MRKHIKKVIEIYEGIPLPIKASLWFTICSVLQKGISFITTPIFTRALTANEYGVYSVYQSWYSIICVIATLNLSAGVFNNGLTKFDKHQDRFESSMVGLSITLSTACCVIYFFAENFWNSVFNLSTLLVFTMLMECMWQPAFLFWSSRQRYDFKYKKLVGVTILMSVISPVLGIITVTMADNKADARIISYAFVQIITGIFFTVIILGKEKHFYDKNYWRFALAFNIPLIPHYLSMTVLNQADRIMISRMTTDANAAIYSIAYTIAMLMTIVTVAINNSFIPYTYKALKNKGYSNIKRNADWLIILIALGCFIVMAFGPEIVTLMAPEEYYQAIWVIPPVAASVFFMFLYPLFGNIEFYYEKTKPIMIASSIGAVLNIVLNYIFIPIWGFYAAGYTTLFCYIMFAVAHYYFYKRIIRAEIPEIDNIYNIRYILAISLLVILVMIFMTTIYKYRILRYGVVLIMAGIMAMKRKWIINVIKNIRGDMK